MTRPDRRNVAWWAGAVVAGVTIVMVAATVDTEVLAATARAAIRNPATVAVMTLGYLTAFALRAHAWVRTLPRLPFPQSLAAIHVATGANHVLPLRLGEALRVTSVVRRTDIDVQDATASTVVLRAADVVAVVGIGLVVAPGVAMGLLGRWWPVVLLGVIAVGGAAVWWVTRLARDHGGIRLPGPVAIAMIVCSWLAEAIVVHQVANLAGTPISVRAAILVTAVTIAAQVAAVAPGGFGTYEAAATAALVAVGVAPGGALAIALGTHAFKTAYALVAGGIGVVRPAPSLLGRLRVPPLPGPTMRSPVPDPTAPIVVFMPAHDEEELVGDVVRRMPRTVLDHPVHCLVIDDGSTDDTAAVAARAGAEVVSLGANQGLGAAVRVGLAQGVTRAAAATVFLDADGEYAPEELPRMVAPILAGRADYVVGSRFSGDIEHMLPHRRLGNQVLTVAVRIITRLPVTDGQSGYRALSLEAAGGARIVHDFNYAQVLTIDLLRRGMRYEEVPISYHFRTAGSSFVRLGHYLRRVVPAIWHSLNLELDGVGAASNSNVPARQPSTTWTS